MVDQKVLERIAAELDIPVDAVAGTISLLAEGATAPFIARYRRERSGGIREDQVRNIIIGLTQLHALQTRKANILKQIETQGKLTEELRARIEDCFSRTELEDLYLPFRSKRRTRGALARERGLDPLAQALLDPSLQAASFDELATPYVGPDRGVPDVASAIEGACHIIAEHIGEDPETRRALRQIYFDSGVIRAKVVEGKTEEHSKYEMYYDFSEPTKSIPSHRVLAVRRGEKEGWLTVTVEVDREQSLAMLRASLGPAATALAAPAIEAAVVDAHDRLLAPAIEADVRSEIKRRADADAIDVFSRNLRGLLIQPAAGPRRTLGVDPGYRTGCKVVAIDENGKLLETLAIFPHQPQAQVDEAKAAIKPFIEKHAIQAVAIGNGNASRETDLFFRQVFKEMPDRQLVRMVVNDAGASITARSRTAREEFPDLDPTLRAAVSIARRFQDPLYELVQIDPKAIGVGQYQHDVNQQALREGLEAAVESCVNFVGADLNRSSAQLLSYISGLDRAVAREIVEYREKNGPFKTRAELMSVPRFDEKRFQLAVGFLYILSQPPTLDSTAIHPERADLVARIAADAGTDVAGLLGNEALVKSIDLRKYAEGEIGEPTLVDIQRELLYPGRDPRRPFRCVEYRDDITDVEHLQTGMILEGTVTNVTNFGAFVDIGVNEDGLVHVSQLARRFVNDPNEAVRVGDIVRVKVISVDMDRRRIGLSMKEAVPPPPPPKPKARPQARAAGKPGEPQQPRPPKRPPNSKATPEDIARLIAHFGGR